MWSLSRPARGEIEAFIGRQAGAAERSPFRRFGFAYGTLPDHVECGEERFSIEWDRDDLVWCDLLAFSRPRYWMARLAYPLARRLQRRFVIESQAAMRRVAAGAADRAPASGAS